MPGYDQTGPTGLGQLTGRGLGPCGRGLKRGFGRCFYRETITLSKDEEKKVLEAEKAELEAELKAVEKKLKEVN